MASTCGRNGMHASITALCNRCRLGLWSGTSSSNSNSCITGCAEQWCIGNSTAPWLGDRSQWHSAGRGLGPAWGVGRMDNNGACAHRAAIRRSRLCRRSTPCCPCIGRTWCLRLPCYEERLPSATTPRCVPLPQQAVQINGSNSSQPASQPAAAAAAAKRAAHRLDEGGPNVHDVLPEDGPQLLSILRALLVNQHLRLKQNGCARWKVEREAYSRLGTQRSSRTSHQSAASGWHCTELLLARLKQWNACRRPAAAPAGQSGASAAADASSCWFQASSGRLETARMALAT